jgi:hypothetical protein
LPRKKLKNVDAYNVDVNGKAVEMAIVQWLDEDKDEKRRRQFGTPYGFIKQTASDTPAYKPLKLDGQPIFSAASSAARPSAFDGARDNFAI